tara:strand:+ start:414 stop:1184 length:771 start_codon:yes stop_codon:yes gene_type:complete
LKTYREHYEACIENFAGSKLNNNVYGFLFNQNFLQLDDYLVNEVCRETDLLFSSNEVVTKTFSRHLQTVKNLKSVNNLILSIKNILQENVFNSYINIEFIDCYENISLKGQQESSSWLWHYDNCPREFMKYAIHLTDSTEDNGCMKIMLSKTNKPMIAKSTRVRPNSRPSINSRISYDKIKAAKEIGYNELSILGKKGSNFLFTPNIIHKATIPKPNTEPRRMLMLYLRPSLGDVAKLSKTRIIENKIDVKEYELD